MSTVAARSATVHRERARYTKATPKRARRRRRATAMPGKGYITAAVVGVIVGIFGYVGLYANLTATSFNRSKLTQDYKQEKIKNERLKVEYARRSSPSEAMAAAQKAGMVYATQYDYLENPQAVASVR